MKTLYLIRHAKSSWSDPRAADFDRKLNKRGKRDAPFMAEKLGGRIAAPGIIIASPARRAKKTAKIMAAGVGYDPDAIVWDERVYHAGAMDLLRIVNAIDDRHDSAFLVGHNYAVTDLAEGLTSRTLDNVPTSGIVAMQCSVSGWEMINWGSSNLLFFDFPKNYAELR